MSLKVNHNIDADGLLEFLKLTDKRNEVHDKNLFTLMSATSKI